MRYRFLFVQNHLARYCRTSRANYSSTTRKRFYEEVSVVSESSSNGKTLHEICLDGRKLKTPAGNVLQIASKPLALAIAQEWSGQRKDVLNVGHMRLTGLAFTAMDNPMHITHAQLLDNIMAYLDSDTVFYMASEPEKLLHLQRCHWGELVSWANATFHLNIVPTDSLVQGPDISDNSRLMLRRHLSNYDIWALHGYQYAVEAVKSLLIVLATVSHKLTTEEAVHIASLEQRFQAEIWGNVDWAHDTEREELCSRLSAGVLFVYLSSNIERLIYKAKSDENKLLQSLSPFL